MAANNSLNLIDLDFDTLKTSLKTYLQGQAQFKDYDFEGSNLSVLLDLLSYNTSKNAFYLNMVLSEAFMDSAQLRSSIVSHAKELNYTPTSRKSAKATITVDFSVAPEAAGSIYTIPKGSLFSTLVKSTSYAFSMPETLTITSATANYTFTTDIYEGFYVKDTYLFLDNEENQSFKITNKNIDTDSITVAVYEDSSEIPSIYTLTQTLLGIDNDSEVYFLQGTGNGYYEILFGDGVFGKKPKINSTIVIDYRTSSGTGPNGASGFSLDFDPTGVGEMVDYTVTTVENASGGGLEQTVESIRKLAPRYFATQQRAVSSDDYSALVLSNFSGTISDVAVYGGETLEPKQYGRVALALKPTNTDIAPDYLKSEVSSFLRKYIAIPNRVIITDPDYFYCRVDTTVQYDKTLTNKKPSELRSLVLDTITTYSDTNLELFDADFRYSRFVNSIDNTDGSITSNDTTVYMIKRLIPTINTPYFNTIDFNNELHPPRGSLFTEPVISSTLFTYRDDASVDYPNSYLRDNGQGLLNVVSVINGQLTTIATVGEIDHANGTLAINGLRVSSYSGYISLYAFLRSKDIIISKNKILNIEPSDVTISVIETLE